MKLGKCLWCAMAPLYFAAMNPPGANAQAPSGTFEVGKFGDLVIGETQRLPTLFRRVERAAFPRDWPLTGDVAHIGCSLAQPQTTILIVIDSVPWALNDATRTWVRNDAPRLAVGSEKVPVIAGDAHEPWLAPLSEAESSPRNLAPLLDVARRMGCMARPATGIDKR